MGGGGLIRGEGDPGHHHRHGQGGCRVHLGVLVRVALNG